MIQIYGPAVYGVTTCRSISGVERFSLLGTSRQASSRRCVDTVGVGISFNPLNIFSFRPEFLSAPHSAQHVRPEYNGLFGPSSPLIKIVVRERFAVSTRDASDQLSTRAVPAGQRPTRNGAALPDRIGIVLRSHRRSPLTPWRAVTAPASPRTRRHGPRSRTPPRPSS